MMSFFFVGYVSFTLFTKTHELDYGFIGIRFDELQAIRYLVDASFGNGEGQKWKG